MKTGSIDQEILTEIVSILSRADVGLMALDVAEHAAKHILWAKYGQDSWHVHTIPNPPRLTLSQNTPVSGSFSLDMADLTVEMDVCRRIMTS